MLMQEDIDLSAYDTDLIGEAANYDTWEEWKDFVQCFAFGEIGQQDDTWYKNVWEGAKKAEQEQIAQAAGDFQSEAEGAELLEVEESAEETGAYLLTLFRSSL